MVPREIDALVARMLSKKRDEYVVAEQDRLAEAGEGDGFDQQVLEAIRTQAAAKGIAY